MQIFHDWKGLILVADFLFFILVGWLYTIWACLMLLSGSFIVFVWWKGGQWREAAEAREAEHDKRFDLVSPSTGNTVPV